MAEFSHIFRDILASSLSRLPTEVCLHDIFAFLRSDFADLTSSSRSSSKSATKSELKFILFLTKITKKTYKLELLKHKSDYSLFLSTFFEWRLKKAHYLAQRVNHSCNQKRKLINPKNLFVFLIQILFSSELDSFEEDSLSSLSVIPNLSISSVSFFKCWKFSKAELAEEARRRPFWLRFLTQLNKSR